jgi:hypothetical protein
VFFKSARLRSLHRIVSVVNCDSVCLVLLHEPPLKHDVDRLLRVAGFFRGHRSDLWDDIWAKHAVFENVRSDYGDLAELVGVMEVEHQFVVLKTGIDPH